MKLVYVYWYHLDTHIDKHLDGYIGVTSDLEQRHYSHSSGRTNEHMKNAFDKYGDKILKDVLFEGTLEECLAYEKVLRPVSNIGWNIVQGGGMPPIGKATGKRTGQALENIREGSKKRNTVSPFKGMTNRYTDEQKAHLGSFHKGKIISEEHKQACRDKMSGSNSPRAVGIRLYHKDKPNIILEFGSVIEASKELSINYASLRSQKNMKRTTFNRKGWAIVFDD